VDRSYVDGLEQQEENPTVDVLDRLAKMLEVPISEFFRRPRQGAAPPKPPRFNAGRSLYVNSTQTGMKMVAECRFTHADETASNSSVR